MSELTATTDQRRIEGSKTKRADRAIRVGLWASGAALTAATLAACGGANNSSGSAHNSISSDSSVSITNGSGNESGSAVSGTASNEPPKPGPATLLPGSSHEEFQQFGTSTFTDYTYASGEGQFLPKNFTVLVDCVATGPVEAAPSAKGKWYHLTGPAPYVGYYAAANTFINGDNSGPLSSQPTVDPTVPACPQQ